jgi:predicted lysophospholipase L1 biosynthesis ABC-type transport system permease subunit
MRSAQDIAIMKSLGMREYAVRRIFIIESIIIGVVGILFGWILGYLLCYGWSKITIFNPLTGTTVPLQIYYSADALHHRRRHIAAVLRRARPISRRARRRGCIRLKSSGGHHEPKVALQAVGLVRRIEGHRLRTRSSTASIWR